MVFNPCLSFVQVCHHSQTFQGKLLCVSVNIIIAECNRENIYFIFGKGSPCVLVNLFQCIGLIESIYTFKNCSCFVAAVHSAFPPLDFLLSCPDLYLPTVLLGSPCLSRSEEHTSELQSRFDLVCRLLLEN